jgi:V/A-type H+/Na+-transporting ATPase subunit E
LEFDVTEPTKTDVIGTKVSSGVEALIQRLRDDGVAAGQAQAQVKLQEAEAQSAHILADARAQAQQIIADAKSEAAKITQGGEDALRIAMRDIVLHLKMQLSELVSERVQHLIGVQLAQETFLQTLIIALAGRVRIDEQLEQNATMQILLPRQLIGLEELRRNPLELTQGSLSHFIVNVAADVLRDGVTFAEADDSQPGIRLYLADREVQIDMTDASISAMLLEHLQPRFRALLEGMVK